MDISQVHVYTGKGKGKTTAALGLGIRCAGAGLKVIMFSFLKNPGASEFDALKLYMPQFKVIIANSKPRNFHWNLSAEEKEETYKDYQSAYTRIENIIKQLSCNVLILDEIMAVMNYNIISVADILLIIQQCRDKHIELVLTGRDAPSEIINCADLVTEMQEIKHPMANGIKARKGIEY
jgi:cob(I)alamin adenosyltransferase